jgi:type I restriction enzyme M protein
LAKRRKNTATADTTSATVGYEAQLWQMADALRGSMDAAEYKHVVLGLIFLKYISDAFEEHHAKLLAEKAQGADPKDPDEYRAQNRSWVPLEARWPRLKAQAKQPIIGRLVDDAMAGIERDNPALKGVLPKDYARPALDKERLGQLIDLISNIQVGDEASRAKDVLGRVYEYFLSQFASAEGKKGGEFYSRAAWSSSSSRCSSPIAAASTTPAAAPLACSCSRWSSSARTPKATATAARPRGGRSPTSRSTARSRTTPPGGSRR